MTDPYTEQARGLLASEYEKQDSRDVANYVRRSDCDSYAPILAIARVLRDPPVPAGYVKQVTEEEWKVKWLDNVPRTDSYLLNSIATAHNFNLIAPPVDPIDRVAAEFPDADVAAIIARYEEVRT